VKAARQLIGRWLAPVPCGPGRSGIVALTLLDPITVTPRAPERQLQRTTPPLFVQVRRVIR